MRNNPSLVKKFVISMKEEGIIGAFHAVYLYFGIKFSQLKRFFKDFLFASYYNIFHHGLVLREIQDNKMYLSVKDSGLSRDLLACDIREPLQTEQMKNLIKSGMTVVDIGANIGYYVLIEASIIGQTGKVYAVEPIPENCELLRKNVRENNYEDIVEVQQCAISDHCGTGKIALAKERNLSTMFFDENELSEAGKKQLDVSAEKYFDVETITLDKFLVNRRQPDFIRMDAEGYEGVIIKGMSNTLINAKNGLQLFVEIHPCFFKDPHRVVTEIVKDLANAGLNVMFMINTKGTEFMYFSQDKLIETICSDFAPALFLKKL